MANEIRILPISGLPEIQPNDDLSEIINLALRQNKMNLLEGDVLVVASKVVAKAIGCILEEENIPLTEEAVRLSQLTGKDPFSCQVILNQSRELIRVKPGVIISRTTQGFVMANAGVDESNCGGLGRFIYLPQDMDAIAKGLRMSLSTKWQCEMAVIISDTFGRPWRQGQTDLAVGVSGLAPILSYRGQLDNDGRFLTVTAPAIADELASAADLCAGKNSRIPAVIIRGFNYPKADGTVNDLIRPAENDLFGKEPPSAISQLLGRRSIRNYDGLPLKKEQLDLILEAGCKAPSAHDSRPWHFAVIESPEKKSAFCRMLKELLEADMLKAGLSPQRIDDKVSKTQSALKSAAVIIILFLKTQLPKNPLDQKGVIEKVLAEQSLALAGGQMLLAAHLQSLGACWYSAPLFCQTNVAEFCGYDKEYRPQAMITIGNPNEPPRKKPDVIPKSYIKKL